MRVFEALACGSLLVTNELTENGQAELFRDGVRLVSYRDGEELLDKLRYYLRKPDLCERIARAGRTEVLAKHTYAHRMRDLLASVSSARDAVPTRSASEDMVTRSVSEATPTRSASDNMVARSASEDMVTRSASEAAPTRSASEASYFDFARPELLALVPDSVRRVLEVGCGAGRLGESIKRRQTCHVTGIERDRAAAERAGSRGRRGRRRGGGVSR